MAWSPSHPCHVVPTRLVVNAVWLPSRAEQSEAAQRRAEQRHGWSVGPGGQLGFDCYVISVVQAVYRHIPQDGWYYRTLYLDSIRSRTLDLDLVANWIVR